MDKSITKGIISELINIAVEKCGYKDTIPDIQIDSTISESFGFDSLSFMDFIAAVEEHYSIVFRDDITFEELNTVFSLIKEIIYEKNNNSTLP